VVEDDKLLVLVAGCDELLNVEARVVEDEFILESTCSRWSGVTRIVKISATWA
jgi:hypothetical protein